MRTRIFLTSVLASTLFNANAFALTLDEALFSAQSNSHEIKQLELSGESAVLAKEQAQSGFLPRIDLTGRHLLSEKFEVLELDFEGRALAMPAIQPYTSLGFQAEWNLFDGFATTNNVKAARSGIEATQHTLSRAEEKTRAGVRALFYKALGSQLLVDVADQSIATLEGHLKDINARIRSGVSTRFEALRTEVQLEEARTEKVAAEDSVVIARARLFQAIGVADDGKPLSGSLPDPTTLDPDHINKIKLEDAKREDRMAQELEVSARESQAKAARAYLFPRVSVFGNYEWYNNTNESVFAEDERFKSAYALGVQLKWNLFDGGAASASRRQAQVAEQISAEKLAQTDQAIPVEIEEAKRKLMYNVVNYRSKLGSIRKAEEAVRLARGGVRAGTRTNTEVLDAVVDLHRARAASIRSQVEAGEALGQLELAVGHELK